MSEITWRAHLDKYASETDTILAKKGDRFLLTIGPEKITIKSQACCCPGKPYVLPLSMVKEAKMLTSQYAMPSFVIIGEKMVEAPADEETGEVPVDGEGAPQMVPEHFFHKFFIEGHEPSIVDVCNKVDAQVRLLQGQVLISGYIDATVPNVVNYFTAADTIQLFETESSMITRGVGEVFTVYLEDDGGTVTFTRLQYGTEILLTKEDNPDFLPSSVFIERVHSVQFALPVYETKIPVNEEETKVFRIAHNKDGTSTASWTVTLDPKVIISAPYLAGLNRKGPGSSRPRTQSFTTGKNLKMPPLKVPPVKVPPVKMPEVKVPSKNMMKGIPGFKKKEKEAAPAA